jgi:hypothetical protein
MSILKQSIFKTVKRWENVLNGFDADHPELEGAVFQCRFVPRDFTANEFLGTDGGVNINESDIVRFQAQDGDTYGFLAKKSFELVKSQPINTAFPLTTLQQLRLFVDSDSEQEQLADTTAINDPKVSLYKNGDKYFQRKYALWGAYDLGFRGNFRIDYHVIISESIARIITGGFLASTAIGDLFGENAENETSSKFGFYSEDGIRKFRISQNYYGVITGASVVPDNSWFYYDGVSRLANGLGDQLTAEEAESIGPGFFFNKAGSLDFSDIDALGTIFADEERVVEGNLTEGRYVLTSTSGGTTTGFKDAKAMDVAIDIDKFSVLLTAAEYSIPTTSTLLWDHRLEFTDPKTNATGLDLELVTADDLTNTDYWNCSSQNFIEDYNKATSTSVVGSHPEGSYTNGVTAEDLLDETITAQEVEIESVSKAGLDSNLVIKTRTRHGLHNGSSGNVDFTAYEGESREKLIVIRGLTGDKLVPDAVGDADKDKYTINGVIPPAVSEPAHMTGVKVLSNFELELLGTTGYIVDSTYSEGNYPILLKDSFRDMVWSQTTPGTSSQGLIYKP